jgi:hypothetical protein
MVTATMQWDTYGKIAPPPRAMMARHPKAFEALLRVNDPNLGGSHWVKHFPDEFGRALLLANYDSIDARYPKDAGSEAETLATLLDFRHAMADRPPLTIIAACDCYAYQASEVSDWESAWANKACDSLREVAIAQATKGQPWGLPDAPEGAPAPGSAGAPISLLSLVKGSAR